MKVLLCPDKLKGSLSAEGVCRALSRGLLHANQNIQITSLPMADGGDGSIAILTPYLQLSPVSVRTVDPLGRQIIAQYHHTDDTAYIELASASGIVLLNTEEQNPLFTSTLGTGIMIKDAVNRGYRKIYLFIGGSATNDGGMGIAQALGYRFVDSSGQLLDPIGANLDKVAKILETDLSLHDLKITVLCDVTNPMHGPNGAAYVHAAQKGASASDIATLDQGLQNYAEVLRSQYHIDLSAMHGIGAAGAVSASLTAILDARIKNGFEMLAKITHLENAIKNADLVITGEGKVDSTSYQGKVVGNVLELCERNHIPLGIVGGVIERNQINMDRFVFQHSIVDLAANIEDAIAFPERFLVDIGKNIGHKYPS